MSRTLFTVIILVAAGAWASPCDDSLFQALRATDPQHLSQADRYFLSHKGDECNAYTDSITMAQQDSVYRIEKEKRWQSKKQAIILGIVCGVLAQIILAVVLVSMGGEVYVTF